MAEKMVPKVAAGKEVRAWLGLEEGVSMGLFCSNIVETRDGSTGHTVW